MFHDKTSTGTIFPAGTAVICEPREDFTCMGTPTFKGGFPDQGTSWSEAQGDPRFNP